MTTTARDAIAEALRLEHNEWDRPQPWHYANADRVLSALLSAPDSVRLELAARLNPWRSIETAPKDEEETAILIGNDRCNDCRVAYYDHEADPTYPWHVEDAAKGFNHHKGWPTHWMPRPALPAPPSEET